MAPASDRHRPPERRGLALALAVGRVGAGLGAAKLAIGVAAASLAAVLLFTVVGAVAAPGGSARPSGGCVVEARGAGPPSKLAPIYAAAAARYRLGSRGAGILAAINEIETAFGTNLNVSSAGAVGWMQFMPETWAGYGVDANGDGVKDPNNPEDAIFAAANYLRASGAPGDWRSAIFSYNHAEWYVDDVLARAESYRGGFVCRPGGESSGAVDPGAIDWNDTSGTWGGSQKFAEIAVQIAHRHGCSVTSAKRASETTTSGNVSDHWEGATHSYAVDLGGCDLSFPGGAADQVASEVAATFGLPAHTGVVDAYHGHYRIQLLWQTYTGGDHYDHVHVGIRNLCCAM